jgi:hypothetical protein
MAFDARVCVGSDLGLFGVAAINIVIPVVDVNEKSRLH